jgi:putative transposase
VLNERHLTPLRHSYAGYYHGFRTHRALDMDTPVARPMQLPKFGRVREVPEVGGLHHHYERMAA